MLDINTKQESPSIIVKGHLLITDKDTGEVVLNQGNAIHPENFSYALANAIGDRIGKGSSTVLGQIKNMAFGRGGSTVSAGTGRIAYLSPNTVGRDASLYQQTYTKLVDDNDPLMDPVDAIGNNIIVNHVPGNLFSDLIITCTLDATEPSGQVALDNAGQTEGDFVFDEIGLVDSTGLLLTHIIFHPIQKTLNRILQVTYNIRIQII